jgi:type I restriction enzyme M protein
MVETILEEEGRVAVVAPHGVLFRAGSEGKIRKKLIQENLLDAVIGLPPAIFFGTPIPSIILVFKKGRKTTDILFIDASREFEKDKKQNKLRKQDIERIIQTYNDYKTIVRYAHRATFEEIKENDFNLNIPRYVDTFEEEEEVDIPVVQKEIAQLEKELADVRKEMDGYLKELGI